MANEEKIAVEWHSLQREKDGLVDKSAYIKNVQYNQLAVI